MSASPKPICSLAGCDRPAKLSGRVYWTDEDGTERTKYLGKFCSKNHRAFAREAFRQGQAQEEIAKTAETITCGEYCELFLARYERDHKPSSYVTVRDSLKRFQQHFGSRLLNSITRSEAIRWAESVPPSSRPHVIALFNAAIDEEILTGLNPFRKTMKKGKGRAELTPPTREEFNNLLDGCDALKYYADQMRALIIFGAYTGMRPGELFALEWNDIDFTKNRIHVQRNIYRGRLQDSIKSGKSKLIALPPPARAVLLSQPTRGQELVFLTKTGKRMRQESLDGYWRQVKARAKLDFDFYFATKHYGVSLLYKCGLSKRAIAAQMGWSESIVDSLLAVYGHTEDTALAEIDALYASGAVTVPEGRLERV